MLHCESEIVNIYGYTHGRIESTGRLKVDEDESEEK